MFSPRSECRTRSSAWRTLRSCRWSAAKRRRKPRLASHRDRFESELRAAEGNVTEVGEAGVLRELRKRWEHDWGELHRFATGSRRSEERLVASNDLESASAAVRSQVQALLDMNQDAMVQKSDRAQREAAAATRLVISASAVALLLGALLSSVATNRLLQPLELLTRTVRRLSEGDFETRVDVPGGDEVAQLANDVNAMAMRLSQYRRSSLGELLLAQEASQAAIDSLPDPVVVFDLSGSIVNVNRAAEALLRLSVGSGGAKPLESLAPEVREALERVRAHVLSGKGAYVPSGFEDAVCVSTPEGERYLLPRGAAGATRRKGRSPVQPSFCRISRGCAGWMICATISCRPWHTSSAPRSPRSAWRSI